MTQMTSTTAQTTATARRYSPDRQRLIDLMDRWSEIRDSWTCAVITPAGNLHCVDIPLLAACEIEEWEGWSVSVRCMTPR